MTKEKLSKLEKWREKYAALVVTIGCLYTVVDNWGENWFWTIISLAGVLICGTIGYFDLKRAYRNKKHSTLK